MCLSERKKETAISNLARSAGSVKQGGLDLDFGPKLDRLFGPRPAVERSALRCRNARGARHTHKPGISSRGMRFAAVVIGDVGKIHGGQFAFFPARVSTS